MSIQFQTVQLYFRGQDTLTGQAAFPNAVNSASAALQGFSLSYSENEEVSTIRVAVDSISISGTTVKFRATMVMRDDSGNSATGDVFVLVIADVEEG